MADPLDELMLRHVEFVRAEIALYEQAIKARSAGVSWTSIARTLGVTRQAAAQRFTKLPPHHHQLIESKEQQ